MCIYKYWIFKYTVYIYILIFQCCFIEISAQSYLQGRNVLLYISYRLPYLSDPVVLQLYQQGKVTHEE